MKKYFLILIAIGFSLSFKTIAQEKERNFGIKFSGFVKNDFFWDTRQTVAAREGHFLLWPSPEKLDEYGNDINAKASFNFLAIQTRLKGTISGPDAFGAKTSGVIEGAFFGCTNLNTNTFRLRHAFVKLNWTNTELLAGQYWNPLFVTGCFPCTVSFNTGTPLQSFARNPQIRLTQKVGNLQFILAALSQLDFVSIGPNPTEITSKIPSSNFLRNSAIPDLHFQIHYNIKNEESGTNVLFGAGAAHKTIVPRLSSVVGANEYKIDGKVSGLTAIGFTKITLKPVTIKLQGRYGENIADVLTISGFAVKNVENATTGERSYTPFKDISFWGEVHTNGKKVQVGIFGGYIKNQGTKEEMSDATNAVYGFGTNIESLIRVSPRIILTSNNIKLACEIEYTSAAYGNDFDVNCCPASTTSVSNTRILLSIMYSF